MRAVIVAGMAFGDEGKGAVTDFLTRFQRAPLVVRYNGGPQAAHNVVDPSGLHHTFSNIGSGTLAGATTFISKHSLVNPIWYEREREVLRDKGVRATVIFDPDAVVITPYHIALNHAAERSREPFRRHGSVGAGVGAARDMELNHGVALRIKDLASRKDTQQRLDEIEEASLAMGPRVAMPEYLVEDLWAFYMEAMVMTWAEVASRVLSFETVIFEGAQGALLDETHGFAPYNTWTDCTFANAESLLAEVGVPREDWTRLGVFRTYFTRHGAGPFPTEDPLALPMGEQHNKTHPWMGPFRVGAFDGELAHYAISFMQPDHIALTHTDAPNLGVVETYRGVALPTPTSANALFNVNPIVRRGVNALDFLVRDLHQRVTLFGSGPCATDYKWGDS